MGAVVLDEGVAFRVWAPFATAVYVTGTFNDWSAEANPLAQEGDGYWSVEVPDASAGDEYKFVIVNGENTFHRNDPYAKKVTNSIGNGIIHDPAFDWGDDAFAMPPWNELVLYELHVGTFNPEEEDQPGHFWNSVERLDYLRDLGINAVEIMPVTEFAGDYSWGYNPAHPFSVESAYGGPEGLKTFVKAAHEHGIAVILDVVYNHFGPTDLDLWQFDGWQENGNGGIYFYNDDRGTTPWGHTRPDYGRAEVRRYIRDNVMMWLEEYRLDGLRWDGTVFIRNRNFTADPREDLPEGWQMMQDINQEVAEKLPGKLMIAEDLQRNAYLTKPVEDGGAGFGSQWDAAFVHPLREAIIPASDEARNVEAVAAAIQHRYNDRALERIIYIESHDEVANGKARVCEEILQATSNVWPAKKRSTLGAALVLTSPGIPMIFQGQELLECKWFSDTQPVDWSKLEKAPGIHLLFRDLIRLRRNLDGTTRGLTGHHVDVYHVNNDDKLLAYRRWADAGDETVVVAHMADGVVGSYQIGFPSPGLWKVRFNSDWSGYSEDFGDTDTLDVTAVEAEYDGLPYSAEITVGPYSMVIFSPDAAFLRKSSP